MNMEHKLTVTEIQRFCMHDGPGIRTTVFLKGCPLRCAWCHNPETKKSSAELLFYPKQCIGCGTCATVCLQGVHRLEGERKIERGACGLCGACAASCPTGALEICGTVRSVEEILSEVEKDRAFYGEKGGITLSGGEPFAQGAGVLALLRACKERGVNTAVETCGYADIALLRSAVPHVDLFLWDVKDTDDTRHKQYTGVSNERILNNLSAVNDMDAKIRLRCILVNGVNTDERHYREIARLAQTVKNFDGVELLPYHAYGSGKAVFLGGEDYGKKEWIPTSEQMARARSALKEHGIYVR